MPGSQPEKDIGTDYGYYLCQPPLPYLYFVVRMTYILWGAFPKIHIMVEIDILPLNHTRVKDMIEIILKQLR